MSSAGDPGPMNGVDPGPNNTLRTSVTGIASGLVTAGMALYILATGHSLPPEKLAALALLPAAISLICANAGSLLAKNSASRKVEAATQKIESLAASTAAHVQETSGFAAGARILDSVGALGDQQPIDVGAKGAMQ